MLSKREKFTIISHRNFNYKEGKKICKREKCAIIEMSKRENELERSFLIEEEN